MKKKVLFALLLITIFTCLLAISVSAEYNKSETVPVTLSDGTTQECALYDSEGNELVWYTLDGGATVVSVKASDLYYNTTGGKLVDSENLTHIYLDAETPLQIHNDNTTNKIVVANLRGCTFKGLYHSGYKATFSDSKVIEYVYLPNTITTMDCNIFQNCTNLKVCDIPSDASFSIISANNFIGCTSLREINLVGCTSAKGSIFHSNFSGCTSLTKVVIDPATIDWPSINGNTFAKCPLTQFGLIEGECTIPASTTYIGDNAFQFSCFTKVNMAGSQVASTGYNIFQSNTSLTEVSFPTTLKTMGIRGFTGCTNLETVIGFENTQLETVPQETFYKAGVTSIVLPSTCTTIGFKAFADDHYNNDSSKYISKLTSVTIPAGFVLIDDYAFQNCKQLQTVTFLGDAGANAVIDQAAFENCYILRDFNVPYGVTTLGNCVCKGAGIRNLTLPSTLKSINGNSHFNGSSLQSVTGLENTQITTIPYAMFRGQKLWTPDVVRIPDTVTSIDQYGFADCGATKFILSARIETIGVEAFVNCANIKEVYIPDTVTSINNSAFNNSKTNNILFFVVSTNSDYIGTIRTGTKATTNAAVDFETYSSNTASYQESGRYVIYGVNKCYAFYNNEHKVDESNKVVEYANGYASAGTCTTSCTVCLEKYTRELSALFTLLGESTPEFVEGTIAIGYVVNDGAFAEYRELTGKEITYGVFAVLQDKLKDNDIFDENGNKADGVIAQEISSYGFSAFELKISGFKTEEQKEASIAMGAYVVATKDGVSKYSYLQAEKPVGNDKYYFISYNDIFSSEQITE